MGDNHFLQLRQDLMRVRLSGRKNDAQIDDLRKIADVYLTLRNKDSRRRVLYIKRSIMEDMHRLQYGRCAICGTDIRVERGTVEQRRTKAHLDHNHTDNSIRGLLCGHCNLMIGFALDSPDILRKAAEYLERYRFNESRIHETIAPEPPLTRGTCVIEGCSKNKRSNGMCDMHYARWRKTGDAARTPKGRVPTRHLVVA